MGTHTMLQAGPTERIFHNLQNNWEAMCMSRPCFKIPHSCYQSQGDACHAALSRALIHGYCMQAGGPTTRSKACLVCGQFSPICPCRGVDASLPTTLAGVTAVAAKPHRSSQGQQRQPPTVAESAGALGPGGVAPPPAFAFARFDSEAASWQSACRSAAMKLIRQK